MLLTPLSISLCSYSLILWVCMLTLSLILSFSLSELWEIETLTLLFLSHVHKYSWEMKTCSLCNSHLSQAHWFMRNENSLSLSFSICSLSNSPCMLYLSLSLSFSNSLYALCFLSFLSLIVWQMTQSCFKLVHVTC